MNSYTIPSAYNYKQKEWYNLITSELALNP